MPGELGLVPEGVEWRRLPGSWHVARRPGLSWSDARALDLEVPGRRAGQGQPGMVTVVTGRVSGSVALEYRRGRCCQCRVPSRQVLLGTALCCLCSCPISQPNCLASNKDLPG